MFDPQEMREMLVDAGCPEDVANGIVESVSEMNAKVKDTPESKELLNAVKFANEMVEKVEKKGIPESTAEEFVEVYSKMQKTSDSVIQLGTALKDGVKLVNQMGKLLGEQIDKISKLEKLAEEYIDAKEHGYFD